MEKVIIDHLPSLLDFYKNKNKINLIDKKRQLEDSYINSLQNFKG